MMQYRRRLLYAGLAIFLISFLIQLPADRVLHRYRDEIPVNIQWQQVTGTVFHPVFYNFSFRVSDTRSLLIESLDVRVSILSLLLGRLKLQFELVPDEGEVSGVVILNRDGWQLSQIEGTLPVQILSMLLPELNMFGPSGRIVFDGNALAGNYRRLPATGRFEANIEGLQLDQLKTHRPLGNYSIQLQTVDGGAVQGKIETVSADALLSVQGDLSMDPAGSTLRFTGQAWVAADAPDSVQGLLSLLGPIEQGRARIQWQAGL